MPNRANRANHLTIDSKEEACDIYIQFLGFCLRWELLFPLSPTNARIGSRRHYLSSINVLQTSRGAAYSGFGLWRDR